MLAMSCAARSRSLESHSSNCSPSAKRTTSRGWGTRGKSTSAKPKSVQEVSGGAGSDIFDMTHANTRIRRFWEGGRIKDAYRKAACITDGVHRFPILKKADHIMHADPGALDDGLATTYTWQVDEITVSSCCQSYKLTDATAPGELTFQPFPEGTSLRKRQCGRSAACD